MKVLRALLIPSLFSLIPVLIIKADLAIRPEIWLSYFTGVALILSQPHGPYLPTRKHKTEVHDKKSAILIIVVIYLLNALWIWRFIVYQHPFGSFGHICSIILGSLLLVLSLFIRIWAIRTLGRMFTTTVQIVQNHELIKTGPFFYVRHPSYLGAILSIISTPILYGQWLLASISMIPLLMVYLYRLRVEETVLMDQFGDQYREYQKSVNKLVPKIY